MGIKLDSRYQEEAYKIVTEELNKNKKAGIIMPTGVGKSFVALKYVEDNLEKQNQFLYVSPSPKINAQIRKTIRKNYDKETTKRMLSKIKFATYHGLHRRYRDNIEEMKEYNSETIILDEVHRSGALEWSKAVDYLIENNQKSNILGMTATPLRNDGQNMIEKRCGGVAYELKLSEAVAKGILKLPEYYSCKYVSEEQIELAEEKIKQIEDEKERKELEEKLQKIKKQVKNGKGLKEIYKRHLKKDGRYMMFCNPGDNIEKLQEQAKKEGIFDEINEKQEYLTIESSQTEQENQIALEQFERKESKEEKLKLLYSKNMLNEGYHDEEITGEIMSRPTKSYILYLQQLGRVLSRDRKTTPIVLDLVGNIRYFKEFELEVREAIKQGQARGERTYDEKVLESFKIIEEQEDVVKSFEQMEESLDNILNRSAISRTLEICKILKESGVNLSQIQLSKKINEKRRRILLKEIEKKGIDIKKIIEENRLDGEFRIGQQIITLRQAYNNKGECTITEEEKKLAERLGLIESNKKNVLSETLEICKILKERGIDLSEIQLSKSINRKRKYILLKEIEQDGIDIQKIIKENELNGKFKLGENISRLRVAYNGNGIYEITEKEKKLAKELGLINKKKYTRTAEKLGVCKILKENGVDLSKIQLSKKINGKPQYILLKEIEQEGIDIEKIIKENGLDGELKLGQDIREVRKAYKGKETYKITEEEKRIAEELGLIKTKDGQEIGKATYDSSVEECDKADMVLEQLIEKDKGKENKYDE